MPDNTPIDNAKLTSHNEKTGDKVYTVDLTKSEVTNPDPQAPGNATGARLRSYFERIERLREEMEALREDEKEVFAEAKSSGFDVKIMRHILKIRKMDDADRAEQEALIETYLTAIGA